MYAGVYVWVISNNIKGYGYTLFSLVIFTNRDNLSIMTDVYNILYS